MINTVTTYLKSLAEPVSWALIHSLWQGALVGILLTIALIILRNKKATVRYVVSCLALLSIVILFVGTVVYLKADPRNPADIQALQSGGEESSSSVIYRNGGAAVVDNYPYTQEENSLTILQKFTAQIPNIFHFWMIGVLLISIYQYVGWHKTRRLIRVGTQPLTPVWQARINRLCNSIGIKYQVHMLKSALVRIPCVVGWLKPVILLPAQVLTGLDEDQLEMIIIHELAHVRRLDCLINYLQVAVETVLYFNPAVWWVSRQIRTERELCCDDMAVKISGNTVLYAKALFNLEGMRQVEPALAMRIDGSTSLLDRIRRLGGQRMQSNNSSSIFKFCGIIAMIILLTMGAGSISGYTEPDQVSYAAASSDDEDNGSYSGQYEGTWKLRGDEDGLYLRLKFRQDGHQTTFGFYQEEMNDIITKKDGEYFIVREAGKFLLEDFDKALNGPNEGSGDCVFLPNTKYANALKDMGFEVEDASDVMELAIHDIGLDYAREIKASGYSDITLNRLIEFHIHDVTPEYIAHLKEVGQDNIPANKIVNMKIHDVEPEYIMEFKNMGLTDLDFDDLIKMSIHDIDPAFIKQFADYGYTDLSVDDLVKLSIQDVDPAYIKSFEKFNLGHLDIDDLVKLSIHDVDPAYIQAYVDMGYKDMDIDDLVRLSIHDVTPEYLKSFEGYNLGFITLDEIVKMSIHDVDPDFVKTYIDLGFEDMGVDELVQMSIHDIDAVYIKELADLGYVDLDPSELVQMRIHDVTPEFIRDLKNRNVPDLTPERLVKMKIFDIY